VPPSHSEKLWISYCVSEKQKSWKMKLLMHHRRVHNITPLQIVRTYCEQKLEFCEMLQTSISESKVKANMFHVLGYLNSFFVQNDLSYCCQSCANLPHFLMQVVGFEKLHKRLKSFFYWCFFAKPSVNNKCLRLPLYANRVKSYLLHIKTGVILQHCHWQKKISKSLLASSQGLLSKCRRNRGKQRVQVKPNIYFWQTT